jgi:hypothetical protein
VKAKLLITTTEGSGMAKTLITIIECTRCQAPQVFKPNSMDSDIPVALYVNLDGGYMNFIDNIFGDEDERYQLLLCHKCAHEFVKWANVPAISQQGHPKTEEEYCDGWTHEAFEKQQFEYIKNKYFPND